MGFKNYKQEDFSLATCFQRLSDCSKADYLVEDEIQSRL